MSEESKEEIKKRRPESICTSQYEKKKKRTSDSHDDSIESRVQLTPKAAQGKRLATEIEIGRQGMEGKQKERTTGLHKHNRPHSTTCDMGGENKKKKKRKRGQAFKEECFSGDGWMEGQSQLCAIPLC